jgi:hypothetical protein
MLRATCARGGVPRQTFVGPARVTLVRCVQIASTQKLSALALPQPRLPSATSTPAQVLFPGAAQRGEDRVFGGLPWAKIGPKFPLRPELL